MVKFRSAVGLSALLLGSAAPVSAQTPMPRAHPLPNGRIGIQFSMAPGPATTLVPGRPVEVGFEVAPLDQGSAGPSSDPTRLRLGFGNICRSPADSVDQSGDSKMVVHGNTHGTPPVPMPGAGGVCQDSSKATSKFP